MAIRNPEIRKISERELRQKLNFIILGISTVIFFSILAVFFYAPEVGSFFGLFSKHRGEEGYTPSAVPSIPVFEDLPEAVNTNEINLKGRAQPGFTIKLYVNGPEKDKTTTDSEGVFNFSGVQLINGKNTLFAKAENEKGVESDRTEYFVIDVDKEPPEISDLEPGDGDTVKNLNKRILISGKINEKATITINERAAVQRPDFTFEYWLGVNEGYEEVKIIVQDEAGNKTEKEITVRYEEKNN